MATKAKAVMEDEATLPEATQGESTAVATNAQMSSTGIAGLSMDMLGAPPYIKAPRGPLAGKKAGTIVYDKSQDVLLDYPATTRMIIQATKPITAVSYDMVEGEDGWAPRAKYDSMEDAVAAGETTEWVNGVGPTVVPSCELLVLVETNGPAGSIEFNGTTWARGIMACAKKDFTVVQNLGRKWDAAKRVPGREFWMLEWTLGLTPADKRGNHYFSSLLKEVHDPDSDYAKEYLSIFG